MLKIMKLNDIKIDMNHYPREYYSDDTAEKYAQAMKMGSKFPPVMVAKIEGTTYLVDGLHRLKAHQKNCEEHIQAEINSKISSFQELYIEAVKTNIRHGRPLSVDDRENIAKKLAEFQLEEGEISKILMTPISKLTRINFEKFNKTSFGKKHKRPGRKPVLTGWVTESRAREIEPHFENQELKRYMIYEENRIATKESCRFIQSFENIDKLRKVLRDGFGISQVVSKLD